jgi:hypothetical protein
VLHKETEYTFDDRNAQRGLEYRERKRKNNSSGHANQRKRGASGRMYPAPIGPKGPIEKPTPADFRKRPGSLREPILSATRPLITKLFGLYVVQITYVLSSVR